MEAMETRRNAVVILEHAIARIGHWSDGWLIDDQDISDAVWILQDAKWGLEAMDSPASNRIREGKTMAYVEKDCTFEHEGRKFEAGGAVVTDQYVICYPRSDGKVCDWHGNVIGEAFVLSSWRTPRSFMAARMYSYAVYINGVRYVGRGAGNSMILRAKRSPRQN